jgi:hypothetical protein
MEANDLAALNTYRYQIDQGVTLNPQQFVRYQALEAEFSRNHEGKILNIFSNFFSSCRHALMSSGKRNTL